MDKISEMGRETSMKSLILLSGGLDSSTCLAYAVDKFGAENTMALSLYYAQKHKRELKSAEKIATYYGVKHIQFDVAQIFEGTKCSLIEGNDVVPDKSYAEQLQETDGQPVSTYVPFRNGLFLSIAASIAISNECEYIYYAAHRDDAAGNAYPDCSEQFNNAMTEAIKLGSGDKITVCDPFIDKTKADIVKLGTELKVPYELTWSCYNGEDKPCGKCGTCIDRIKAFKINGTADPLKY